MSDLTATRRQAELRALDKVRRRVVAIGFFAIASHGVFGLIGVAHVLVGQDRHDDAVLLTIMSGIVALIVCAATRAILGARRPLSLPWAVLSVLPTVAALIWVV